MKTHLIDDLDNFGIWINDYQRFIDKRARRISEEIEKRIIRQEIDKQPQPELLEDNSEVIEIE